MHLAEADGERQRGQAAARTGASSGRSGCEVKACSATTRSSSRTAAMSEAGSRGSQGEEASAVRARSGGASAGGRPDPSVELAQFALLLEGLRCRPAVIFTATSVGIRAALGSGLRGPAPRAAPAGLATCASFLSPPPNDSELGRARSRPSSSAAPSALVESSFLPGRCRPSSPPPPPARPAEPAVTVAISRQRLRA